MSTPGARSTFQFAAAFARIATSPLLLPGAIVAWASLGLAVVTARRLAFPYDLFVWADSPFMTDMMKLSQGAPIYGPIADANSFMYAPGHELLTFALLRPFGAQLDVRACRAVIVVMAVAAAAVAGACAVIVRGARGSRHVEWVVATALGWLVISRNFTSDILHPDNLHMLHASTCLLCALLVHRRRSARAAIVGALVAGLGVLNKQTEAASLVPFLVVVATTFGVRSTVFVAASALGFGTFAASAGWLFSNPSARFHLVTLISHHGLDWAHARDAVREVQVLHRVAIIILAIVGLRNLGLQKRLVRSGMLVWGLMGAGCVLPNALAFFKVMGAWNNFGIFDLWLLVPAWAGVFAAPVARPQRIASNLLFVLLVWFVRPVKEAPSAAYVAHFRDVGRRISEDFRANRRVLVGHGASFLIDAGVVTPPLDRENSVLELATGGYESLAGTRARLLDGSYDRVYVLTDWYPPSVVDALKQRYVVEESLAGPTPGTYQGGFQGFGRVEIWTLSGAVGP